MRLHIDVVQWRGQIPESRHHVQAAVVRADGTSFASTEDADQVTTFRSAAKPFQLLPLVERGHADAFGFSDEHLAVMASSHTGSSYHVGLVRELLERIGKHERDLACGYHTPLDSESAEALHGNPELRSPIYHNCSGKHAGMLALALAEGWSPNGYEKPEHAVQMLMRRTVASVCGLAPETLKVGVDGCSVSVFGLPLGPMARAYARLGVAEPEASGALEPRPKVMGRDGALARIRRAMQAHPRATGGDGRFSSVLMERVPRLVAKGGAEGLECIAVPEQGLGLAFKCEDGAARALPPAVIATLECLNLLDRATSLALEEWRQPRVLNNAGLDVGSLLAEVRVEEPARP